jgi:hypothetical protein
MSAFLQLPCGENELTIVELTDDAEMLFHDYDIDEDLMLAEIGEEPTICVLALELWEMNPLGFLCRSDIIPSNLLGLITCRWVEEVVKANRAIIKEYTGCQRLIDKHIAACRRFWLSKASILERVYITKQNLTACWNKYANKRKQSIYFTNIPYGLERAFEAVFGLSAFIIEFVDATEHGRGLTTPLGEPCNIAKNSSRGLLIYEDEVKQILATAPYAETSRVLADDWEHIKEDRDNVRRRLAISAIKVMERYG